MGASTLLLLHFPSHRPHLQASMHYYKVVASTLGEKIESNPTIHIPSWHGMGHLEYDYSLEDPRPKHVPPPAPRYANSSSCFSFHV